MQDVDKDAPGEPGRSEPDGHLNPGGSHSKDEDAPPPTTGEVGGRDGPEPTRFGDWEKNGRCIDF